MTLRRAAERVRSGRLLRGFTFCDPPSWSPPSPELVAALLEALASEVEHDDLSLQRDLVDDPDSLICRAGYLLALDVLSEKPGDPS